MNTVTIEIPDNMELIQEGDIYKLSPIKPKTWEEFCEHFPISKEFFIGGESRIGVVTMSGRHIDADRNLFKSIEDAEAVLALIQLIRLRQSWIGEWNPDNNNTVYYIANNIKLGPVISYMEYYTHYHTLIFPSEDMASEFVRCFKDLIDKAKKLIS